MKQRHFLLSIIAFSTGLIINASPVYFGAGGLVKRKSAAVAELLPWEAKARLSSRRVLRNTGQL